MASYMYDLNSYTVTPESFRVSGPKMTMELTWEAFYSVHETNRMLILYTAGQSAWPLPKRFLDAAGLTDFRSMIPNGSCQNPV